MVMFLVWAQAQSSPIPGHSATEIGPGSFASGDYRITGNLNVTSNVLVTENVSAKNLNISGSLSSGGSVITTNINISSYACLHLGNLTSNASNAVTYRNQSISAPGCMFGPSPSCSFWIAGRNLDGGVMAMGRFVNATLLQRSDTAWISMVTGYNVVVANLYVGFGVIGNGQSEEIVAISSTTAGGGRCSINDDGDGGSNTIELITSASGSGNARCDFYVCP